MSESKQGTDVICPVCKKEICVDDVVGWGFLKRAKTQPDLLAACKNVAEALEFCGYGGSNSALEKRHEKMLKAVIAQAEER